MWPACRRAIRSIPRTTLAPLSSKSAADEIKDMIRQAVEQGAKAEEVGPPRAQGQGAFVQPTILTDVGENNPARYWEFFGPVSMLFRAKDEDDAVRIANDSPFGLGGSVFTSDTGHGVRGRTQDFDRHGLHQPSDHGRRRTCPSAASAVLATAASCSGSGINEFVNHKLIDVVDIDAPILNRAEIRWPRP